MENKDKLIASYLAKQPNIRRILMAFQKGEWLCVKDIMLKTGLKQSFTSKYLRRLEEMGLFTSMKIGSYRMYTLTDLGVKVQDILHPKVEKKKPVKYSISKYYRWRRNEIPEL